jgi:REP element-mobilizing transposase RayT
MESAPTFKKHIIMPNHIHGIINTVGAESISAHFEMILTNNMNFNPKIHQRKSIRMKGFDYTQPGYYFVTICCQNKECLFGDIINGQLMLNIAGEMIKQVWVETLTGFSNTRLQNHIIMPNHFHGIIQIVGAESISAQSGESADIPVVIQSFKRNTTIKYINMVKRKLLPSFNKRIWQRNYWEHIIRNEESYKVIVDYIENNSANWLQDKLYKS